MSTCIKKQRVSSKKNKKKVVYNLKVELAKWDPSDNPDKNQYIFTYKGWTYHPLEPGLETLWEVLLHEGVILEPRQFDMLENIIKDHSMVEVMFDLTDEDSPKFRTLKKSGLAVSPTQ